MAKPGAISVDDIKIKGQIGPRGLSVLLRVQEIVSSQGDYNYLEIGSFLGRTLGPHILDDDCKKALSIDLRPAIARDERGDVKMYRGITAEHMTEELLRMCTKTQTGKLTTVTDTSDYLRGYDGGEKFGLAFIDAEHTNTAVFKDFLNARHAMENDCVICFDDTHIVYSGIMNAVACLEDAGTRHNVAFCQGCIAVVGIGEMAALIEEGLGKNFRVRQKAAERRYRSNMVDSMVDSELERRLQGNSDLTRKLTRILERNGYEVIASLKKG